MQIPVCSISIFYVNVIICCIYLCLFTFYILRQCTYMLYIPVCVRFVYCLCFLFYLIFYMLVLSIFKNNICITSLYCFHFFLSFILSFFLLISFVLFFQSLIVFFLSFFLSFFHSFTCTQLAHLRRENNMQTNSLSLQA